VKQIFLQEAPIQGATEYQDSEYRLEKVILKHLFEENSLQSMKQNGMKVANNVASFSNIVS